MRHEELFYLLALQKVEGVGDITAKKLLSHFGSASSVFNATPAELQQIANGNRFVKSLREKSVFKKAEAELAYIESSKIKSVAFTDPDYPERLKHCADGPVLLFSSGDTNVNKRKVISIVGTRQITAHGIDFCRKLVGDLAPLDPIIISGFALGADITAHLAAIDNGLKTIGVLAHGLNQIYPKSHRKYVSAMHENGGFLTEFWSSSIPEQVNFVKRNRIVAGMSEATIIVESADKGGSLITANLANDYNREVFAVPGRVSDAYSQGCNRLIKTQKANLLTDAADLVYMLNWDLQPSPKPVQKQLFVSLSSEEQKVYDFLLHKGKESLDNTALECGLPVFKMSSLLLNLELKGVVRPLPGKLFEAV